jgi:hypothetical protein
MVSGGGGGGGGGGVVCCGGGRKKLVEGAGGERGVFLFVGRWLGRSVGVGGGGRERNGEAAEAGRKRK